MVNIAGGGSYFWKWSKAAPVKFSVAVYKPVVSVAPHGVKLSLHQLSLGIFFPVHVSYLFYLKEKSIQGDVGQNKRSSKLWPSPRDMTSLA